MDKELIERFAKEAGFNVKPSAMSGLPWIDDRSPLSGGNAMAGFGYEPPKVFDSLERFAALVAEECAKACERHDEENMGQDSYYGHGCMGSAAAIRALFK